MSRNVWSVLVILICILVHPVRIRGFSWNIFSSSSSTAATGGGDRGAPMTMELDGAVADFAMDGGANNDPRGLRLLENARDKLAGPRNCWQDAYRKLFASCGEIMADKERQSRLAWHLTGCFQEDSGRPPFPPCAEGSKMVHCRKRLSESEGKVFLEFFLETNTLCHQLQAEAFKHNIFCCSGQAVHSAQCHSCRVSLHQGLLLLLLHCVPRLHAHQRKANVRHQGPTLLWSVHYASIGDWVDQNWRRRFRQAVPGHVQVVLAPNGVPRRCHCSDPALHIHLQGLRYEVLNHGLLQTLVEKVRALEENAGERAPSYGSESEEESLRDYSWVFDDELADEVDSKMDPTYVLPPPERLPPTQRRRSEIVAAEEIVGENSITTSVSRKYNLRPRK